MYHMMQFLGVKDILRREPPVAVVVFFVAEIFHKSHFFTLEALAFLAPW